MAKICSGHWVGKVSELFDLRDAFRHAYAGEEILKSDLTLTV